MLNVVMLKVIILSVIMLNVIMLKVVGPVFVPCKPLQPSLWFAIKAGAYPRVEHGRKKSFKIVPSKEMFNWVPTQ